MRARTWLAVLLSVGTLGSLPARAANPIDTLVAGEWLEVRAPLRSVDPCPTSDCSYSAAEGQAAVAMDWSGGAFDTARDRLMVWGGGHGGYAGNELYAFDLATLTWQRLTEPTSAVSANVLYYADGRPSSRHTYNALQYVPGLDLFCSFGAAGVYGDGQHGGAATDCWNFSSGAWVRLRDSTFTGIGSFTAVDSATGLVWGKGTGYTPSYDVATQLSSWDPTTDTATPADHGNADLAFVYEMTAAIDPKRHVLVAIGGGHALAWDLSTPSAAARRNLAATGATEIEAASAPGLAYDPVSDRFVAWAGGASVYVLDLTSQPPLWSRIDPVASNTVTPTAAIGRGTFGRFRYSPKRNVFVAVNRVDDSVFIYRLTNGGAAPLPHVQLSASSGSVVAGSSVTLSWSSENATGCSAAGGWSGPRMVSGSASVGPLSASTTFTMTCSGPAGVGGASVTVTVKATDGGVGPGDGGVGPGDGGVGPGDGGVSPGDGGVSPGDGGGSDAGPTDGGAPFDAGAAPSVDAGALDLADSGTEANVDAGSGQMGSVAGRCGCGSVAVSPPWVVALVLASRSRRRRPS